jgi:hypothetical protein
VAELASLVSGQCHSGVEATGDGPQPTSVQRLPHLVRKLEDALPDQQRVAATNRDGNHLRRPTSVSQHDVRRLGSQQPPQPPCACDKLGRPLCPGGPKRHQPGRPATVEGGAQGHDAVPMTELVQLIGQLQRHQLRTPPLTP